MTAQEEFWELTEHGDLDYRNVLLPPIYINVILTRETFATVMWNSVIVEADGSIDADARAECNALLDLWRQQINQVQARIDALPTYQPPPKYYPPLPKFNPDA